MPNTSIWTVSNPSIAAAMANPVPFPMSRAIWANSIRARFTSCRARCAPSSAMSRRSCPTPRFGGALSIVTLPPQHFADQITGAQRDQQRTSGMLFHLLLDACLDLVEIGVAQPLRALLHSSRQSVGHGSDAGIVHQCD